MTITLVSFTKRGGLICSKITNRLRESGHHAIGYSKYESQCLLLLKDKLYDFTKTAFDKSKGIVFIGAVGIAVRAIAPFIYSKDKDPAVIVVDEAGKYIIPILSGHLGGGNEIANEIADILKGQVVITTATDINNKFAVDVWATKNNLHIENVENIKYISAAILNNEKIGFYCDYPVEGLIPSFFTNLNMEIGICICDYMGKKPDNINKKFDKTLIMRPKRFFVGIGCRKGIDSEKLEEFFIEVLDEMNIPKYLVSNIATIDIKKEERSIVNLCCKYGYLLKTYTSQQLREVKGEFTSSEFVKNNVGVDNVCERAAYLASNNGNLILRKRVKNKITIAIAVYEWRCSF
ncbi:MAG: cobalt-precorrin 5A hydrolase [Clostridiales bacterium]